MVQPSVLDIFRSCRPQNRFQAWRSNIHRTSTRRRVHTTSSSAPDSTRVNTSTIATTNATQRSSSSAKSLSTTSSPPSPSARYSRLLSRLPKFLHPTVSALRNAPVTHITSFLVLHELTAVIPLFGLAGAFHYYGWLPPYFAEGRWVVQGVERFGRYFERKGWIDRGAERDIEGAVRQGVQEKQRAESSVGGDDVATKGKGSEAVTKWWGRGEGATRWIVEFATAYAVVKAFLPLRLVVSVWATPWFARWTVIPLSNGVKRMFGKGRTISNGSKI